MEALRTPDERFDGLPGYGYRPRYATDLAGFPRLRVHYVDEGPRNAATTFLCLHGQPTWSYLYRRMIPVFTDAGCRVIAPDLFGFGRSDKPVLDEVYTFTFHREMLLSFVRRLDLHDIALVVQDWGGLLGLTLPLDLGDRVTRLIVMNTTLPTGDEPLSEGFLAWRAWVARNPDMNVPALMQRSCPHLSPEECRAYGAPFPDQRYKAGVRRFPGLVPDRPDAEGAAIGRKARDFWSNSWTGASFMAVGMQDPVLGPSVMARLRGQIRNCPEPMEIADGGHFVQEWGETIARRAIAQFGLG